MQLRRYLRVVRTVLILRGATEEPATVQGNEATVYQMETEDGDKITVLWTDMEKGWIVRVTGYNISKEDMLRISESVEIR